MISINSKNYYFYELWFEARAHAISKEECKCFDCAIFYFVKSEFLPLRQVESNSDVHQISIIVKGDTHQYSLPFAGGITSKKVITFIDNFLNANGELGHDWHAIVLSETFARLTNTPIIGIIHSLDFLSEFTIVCKGLLSYSGQDEYWPEYRELITKCLFESEGNERQPFMLTLSAQEGELKKINDFSIPAQMLATPNQRLAEEFNRSERAAAEGAIALNAQYKEMFGINLNKANEVEKRKIGVHLALASHVSRAPVIEMEFEMDKLLIMENFDAWIPQPWIVQIKNIGFRI